MKLKSIFLYIFTLSAMVSACSNDDSFTVSPNDMLTFSTDTLSLDTAFSNVQTATKNLWVYNKSGKGIRCTSVRLEKGNQTGFQVNVDGIFLGSSTGYQTTEIEIRNKDSIRIYVKLLPSSNYQNTPKELNDNIVFTLESGAEQKINLKAFSWDANVLRNVHIDKDSVLSSVKPMVIYGGITVDSSATLSLPAGTTLYFHGGAGIDVRGRLICNGTPQNNVVLRGDRLDKIFDYLPYDNVSGQWKGIILRSSSYDNEFNYTDIHSTFDGIVSDSSDISKSKLLLNASTIHNCQGYGLLSYNSNIILKNSVITNTLNDCFAAFGGRSEINGCTFAQFYPFDGKRGVALKVDNIKHEIILFNCINTLITGFTDDELSIVYDKNKGVLNNIAVNNCIIRTPEITPPESVFFTNIIYENVKDTVRAGEKNFVRIDREKLRYDFRLRKGSLAIDKASMATSLPTDRNGVNRDTTPDIGAFEFKKE